jgi:glucose-1-phosphate thymidylyltransferase
MNKSNRKGIILSGGSGTRLYPATLAMSKQLLPVYDKPMIYYPITTLMLAGIREILVITTPHDNIQFKNLLGDGSNWGIHLEYAIQDQPKGLTEALIIGEKFIDGKQSALALGDNIFYGNDFPKLLSSANDRLEGASLFAYLVYEPERDGVAEFDKNKKVISLEEKPVQPRSNYAVTGLYFYDENVSEYAKQVAPSHRGELEITDLNQIYLDKQKLSVEIMGRGYAWLDTGTHESLLESHHFVQTIEHRQGLKIACPEEIAYKSGWISQTQLEKQAAKMLKTSYGKYLMNISKEELL